MVKETRFVPPSLRCRLSIIESEVKRALEAESEDVNSQLVAHSVDVALGAVGCDSPMTLISSAYECYKQLTSSFDKERAGRKHFALKYLDLQVPDADRIFCYIMFKNSDSTVSPKRIREVVEESRLVETNFESWRDLAYSKIVISSPAALSVNVVLRDFYIAPLRALTMNDCKFLLDKEIAAVVVYSEFTEFGYDVTNELPLQKENIVVVEHSDVQSLRLSLFVQIHKWRTEEVCVCVACDTDGLTVCGLLAARYVSLCAQCSPDAAVHAVRVSHSSFSPAVKPLDEFLSLGSSEDEIHAMELQVPGSLTMRGYDQHMIANYDMLR